MIPFENWAAFLGSAVLLTIAPGPDNIFVITQGISNGRKAGVVTALGLCSGTLFHTAAAAAGIAVVLKTHPLLFKIILYCGAVYLLYLARRSFLERNNPLTAEGGVYRQQRLHRLFLRGLVMNLLNPKVLLFFAALLPQFIAADAAPPALQMVLLGLTFTVQGVIIFSLFGYFAGSFAEHLLKNRQAVKTVRITAALIFSGLGIRLLVL